MVTQNTVVVFNFKRESVLFFYNVIHTLTISALCLAVDTSESVEYVA